MSILTEQHCEACRSDAPRVTEAEREQLLPQIPDWVVARIDGVEQLQRSYSFPDFAGALVDAQDPWPAPQRFRHGSAN